MLCVASQPTVRPGRPADIEPAAALFHHADRTRLGSPGGTVPARLAERLRSPDAIFVVSSHGPSLIGMAAGVQARHDGGAGDPIPGLCHITMVAVHPDHWGHGVGRRLLDALIPEVREHGYDRAQLFTQTGNTRARRLYEGLGFTRSGLIATADNGEEIAHYTLALH